MTKCIVCDDEFTPEKKNIVRCLNCRTKTRQTKKCLDCSALIGIKAKRCKMCHNISIRGSGNPNYLGRYKTTQGYIVINDSQYHNHPNAHATGKIMEHILVMSKHLGRPLVRGEEVHHRNGNRADNRIENLELWTRSHPTGVRVSDMYEWCKNYIERYQNEINLIS